MGIAVDSDEVRTWLFQLFLRREVLSEFETAFIALADLCESEIEFEILKHTVEKLVALSNPQYVIHLGKMAEHIKRSVSGEEKVAVVAMCWGSDPDSSQRIVQQMKPLFRGINNVTFFNSVTEFAKKGRIAQFGRYFLVDEFSGTGTTILNRERYLGKIAGDLGVSIESSVCIMFGMVNAQQAVELQGIDCHFVGPLEAGISGHFVGAARDERIAAMRRLEAELAPLIDGEPLPSLGHGAAEALFFVINENAPNSNFPIFWWPKDATNADRNTVMLRCEL